MTTPDELLAQVRAEQEAEWNTYIAKDPIDINGARAFNPGNAVPVSHVEGGLVPAESVEKRQQDEQPEAAANPAASAAQAPAAPVENEGN